MNTPLHDQLGRCLTDLRVSVTDRCNLRCPYCMPREVYGDEAMFLGRSEILSYEEIGAVVNLFVSLGVDKVRITGGEPLLRRDLPSLITALRRNHPDLDLALTTNGVLLADAAQELAAAGLDRVTVSLDALDSEVAQDAADTKMDIDRVLLGIERAVTAGLTPVKVNVTVVRGVNDQQIVPIIDRLSGAGVIVRLIEFMDVGSTNGWKPEMVVSAAEMRRRIELNYALESLPATRPGEVASRYRLDDGGEIGVIASVTDPFCQDCTRARLAANGVLYTCLFASVGIDLRAPLRAGVSDQELVDLIDTVWRQRVDRYSEQRAELVDIGTSAATTGKPRVEMSYIGG